MPPQVKSNQPTGSGLRCHATPSFVNITNGRCRFAFASVTLRDPKACTIHHKEAMALLRDALPHRNMLQSKHAAVLECSLS